MRLLFLTPQLPYPPHQGTTIRNYQILRHLAPGHEMTLLSFGTDEQLEAAAPLRAICRRIEIVPYPSRTLTQRAISTLFSPSPDMALRLRSQAMHSKAAAIQTQDVFDLLQVEGIEMAGYIAQSSSSRTRPVVFDDHNAEYVLQRTAFESDIHNPARWHGALYSFIQTRKLARYERTICRRANRVVAASRTDAHALAALAPEIEVRVIPNGVDTTCFAPPEETPATSSGLGSSLVYTGKMDFRPNVDAMTWFCRDILPRIRAVVPLAHLDIVGQSPSPPVLALRSPHVNVTGWVPDTRPYLNQAAVCVVPLRMGSGTRLKVLEAMAMGRAIVSTTRGIEGIGCLPGRDLLVADSPDSFASAVVELLQDPAKRRALGLAARALAVSQYDWKQIVPAFEQIYSDLLPERRAAIM